MVGRDGSPEATTPIPVASYDYGHASNGGRFGYIRGFDVAGSAFVKPATKSDHSAMPPSGEGFSTWSKLLDLTGDGVPDNLQFNGNSLQILRDWMHAGTLQPLSDGVLPNKPIETRTVLHPRYQTTFNVEQLWRQAIDVNGDGRIDFIDASEEAGRWVVYLNLPDPSDPGRPHWARRSYSTQALAGDLQSRGFSIDANHLPLAQRTTAHSITARTCWHWVVEDRVWDTDPSGFITHRCSGSPGFDHELTFTEWEVNDINSDGYPDVVFNSSPLTFNQSHDPPPSTPGGQNPNLWTVTEDITTFELPALNEIDVVFNVLGVHVGTGSQPFSGVIALRTSDNCGVAQWVGDRAGSNQANSCGIADVNGDGIPDRVNNQSVYLGTGILTSGSFFTPNALLTLPGPLAVQRNEQATKCAPPATGATTFTARQAAGLHDLNGDGIPDYVAVDATGNWSVRVGTGTGFLNSIPIGVGIILGSAPPFALSEQTENCAGTLSTTTTGLYDLDGDGKPEVLGADGSVATLSSDGIFPRAHDAGRLVRIDNGFGASTIIGYGPAKRLVSSSEIHGTHQVPFPEVVVSFVQTLSQNRQTILAGVQYAYGGAELVFDPVADRFTFPGYRRQVVLTLPVEDRRAGLATITDIYEPTNPADPYDLESAPLTAAQRYARYLRVGRVSDVTVLSGDVGTDAVALLATDVTSDVHRIASTHYEYDARSFAASADPPGPEPCSEMVYPYDYARSVAYPSVDACATRGVVFATSVQSSRGTPGAASGSDATVTTRSEVRTVDDLGRPTSVKNLGDLARTDDDLCIDTAYAAPTGQNERVLSAASKRTVTDCGTTIYAQDTFQYDELDVGKISKGLPTSHTVERRDENGVLRGTVREFDAQFTSEGNPSVITTKREAGVIRTATVRYDDDSVWYLSSSVLPPPVCPNSGSISCETSSP